MPTIPLPRFALASTDGRNYGGRAMAIGAPETDPMHPASELRLGAEGMPDVGDSADRSLIERAGAGDAAAVATLVRQLLPTVRATVRARLGSRMQAGDIARPVDDLVQEVFLQLFARDCALLRSWDGTRGLPLARFVALVADRRVISELRIQRATDGAVPIDAVADDMPDTHEQPESWYQNRQSLLIMFDALTARLSPLGRRVFHLLFVEECEVDEVCADTGMGVDAVYAWRSRLRRRAAQILEMIHAPSAGARR